MTRLFDTDVLVDIVRQHPSAVTWLTSLSDDEPIGVPGPVALELIEGCKNRQETNRIMRLVNRYPIYWPSSVDGDRALRSFAQHHLAHNMSSFDALIAQCAIGLGATLVTFNVRHFRVIANLTTEQPYQRQRTTDDNHSRLPPVVRTDIDRLNEETTALTKTFKS